MPGGVRSMPPIRQSRRSMASPGAVRGAVALSFTATTAAALYIVSEGGDPDKLRAWVSERRVAIEQFTLAIQHNFKRFSTAAAISTSANQSLAQDNLSGQVTKDVAPPIATPVNTAAMETPAVPLQNSEPSTREISTEHTGPDFCHTCSGPRIWYFAEKLNPRLKRRFTPYPDPPLDE